VVRVRLTDTSIRRVMDSMDVCQSVLANFFVRMSVGQFDLNDPQDLIRLLVRMTQNKILDHVRRQQADRRDRRREVAGSPEALEAVPEDGSSPSQKVANKELLDLVRQRLSDEERYLAEQRALGREWQDLAKELRKTPESLRKQYTRAIDRVTRELGVE
jgi:RNA polymerase sigma-70 factor (ECF subfamily)